MTARDPSDARLRYRSMGGAEVQENQGEFETRAASVDCTRRGPPPLPRTLVAVLVLAFDTATPAVTVALCDGAEPLAEHSVIDARRHGELLAPGIDRVLGAAGRRVDELDAIVVGVGPGPYTSLRVGLVTAHTLGDALRIPVHGVCTLDALALGAGLDGEYLVATDARRKEVYWARYVGTDRVEGPGVARAAELHWRGPTVGFGAQLYPDALPDGREPLHPSAAQLAQHHADGGPLVAPWPIYLRQPDASPPGPRKSVLT